MRDTCKLTLCHEVQNQVPIFCHESWHQAFCFFFSFFPVLRYDSWHISRFVKCCVFCHDSWLFFFFVKIDPKALDPQCRKPSHIVSHAAVHFGGAPAWGLRRICIPCPPSRSGRTPSWCFPGAKRRPGKRNSGGRSEHYDDGYAHSITPSHIYHVCLYGPKARFEARPYECSFSSTMI